MKIIRKIACLALAVFLAPIFPAGAVEAGYTVFHGDREQPRIALTVDDCYNIDHVQAVIDLCREYNVPVTFFVIGKALKVKDREVWQAALDAGCEIGNHTFGHARLPDLSRDGIISQLTRTQSRLDEVLGWHYAMQVMRPPYGRLSADPSHKSDLWVVEAIEDAGYVHAVRWDVSQTDPDKALRDVQCGSILLYHANARDILCLTRLIPDLVEAGYECVTVSELLSPEPTTDTAWLVMDEPSQEDG